MSIIESCSSARLREIVEESACRPGKDTLRVALEEMRRRHHLGELDSFQLQFLTEGQRIYVTMPAPVSESLASTLFGNEACAGGCGKRGPAPWWCAECFEGARILNRNALAAAKSAPRLCVAVLVTNDRGQILLGRRNKDPNRGKWVMPGGGVEGQESWVQAAVRELKEETGLAVGVSATQRPHVVQPEVVEGQRRVCILFVRGYSEGAPVGGDDLLDPAWFDLAELPKLPLSPVSVEALGRFKPASTMVGWDEDGRAEWRATCGLDEAATIPILGTQDPVQLSSMLDYSLGIVDAPFEGDE